MSVPLKMVTDVIEDLPIRFGHTRFKLLVVKVREVLARHVIGEKRRTSAIMSVMNCALRLFGVRLEFL